eukprot:3207769-Amphidinium_carterae.1
MSDLFKLRSHKAKMQPRSTKENRTTPVSETSKVLLDFGSLAWRCRHTEAKSILRRSSSSYAYRSPWARGSRTRPTGH